MKYHNMGRGSLQATETYSVTVLKNRSQNQEAGRLVLPPKPLGEETHPSSSSGSPGCFLNVALVCLHLDMTAFPLYLSESAYKDARHIEIRSTLRITISSKTLLPGKVTLTYLTYHEWREVVYGVVVVERAPFNS